MEILNKFVNILKNESVYETQNAGFHKLCFAQTSKNEKD